MDSRVAEIRARADRRVQEASRAFRAQQQRAEAESAVIRRQAEEHSTTMQGVASVSLNECNAWIAVFIFKSRISDRTSFSNR